MNVFFVAAIALLVCIPACGGNKKKVSKVETIEQVPATQETPDTNRPARKF